MAIKYRLLRELLSANIKKRREVLDISQEKLAELADISIQTVKGIEGRRTWVSDEMLEKLAQSLGVAAFQLLSPVNDAVITENNTISSILLNNLKKNIQDDIDSRFTRLQTHIKIISDA